MEMLPSSNLNHEEFAYAERVSQDVLSWIRERHQKSKGKALEFKLSECKDRFKTISDRFLMAACELLAQQCFLIVDDKSRIVKYSLVADKFPVEELTERKDETEREVSVVEKKRKREKEEDRRKERSDSDLAADNLKEDKENHCERKQPITKKPKIVANDLSNILQKKEKNPHTSKATIIPSTTEREAAEVQAPTITVTDITMSGQKLSHSEREAKESMSRLATSSNTHDTAATEMMLKKVLEKEEVVSRMIKLLTQSFAGKEEASLSSFVLFAQRELTMSEKEVQELLKHLEAQNHIMIDDSDDGVIYKMW